MKRFILTILSLTALVVNAEVFTFDFNNPSTLNPAVNAPAQKDYINLNGRSFTSGPVTAAFSASTYGNTHVRIYHSYDAGIDLRLYDGDVLTVSVPDNMILKSIEFTMSLSGNASGSNDINFISDTGDFVWEDECWTPDVYSPVSSVELTSARQSRIYTMSVDVEESTSITELSACEPEVKYFTLSGLPLIAPAGNGIYFIVSGNKVAKIIVK